MALKQCKKCGEQVKRTAKKCPHCGVSNPTLTAQDSLRNWLSLVLAGVVIAVYFSFAGDGGEGSREKSANSNNCVSDWRKCNNTSELVENNDQITMAQQRCETAADRQANYGEPEFPFIAFSSYLPDEEAFEKGKVTLLEDQAKFENQYGAMTKVEARCVYDLKSKSVVSFEIHRP